MVMRPNYAASSGKLWGAFDSTTENFRKFRFKIKWNRKFPETYSEKSDQPLEVVLFSGNLKIPEIYRSL